MTFLVWSWFLKKKHFTGRFLGQQNIKIFINSFMHSTNVYWEFSMYQTLELQKRNKLYLCLLHNLMRKIAILSFYNNLLHFTHCWIYSHGNDTKEWLKSGAGTREEGLSMELATLKASFWNTGIAISKDHFEISPYGTADNRILLSLEARKWVTEWNEWDEKLRRVRD